MDCKAQIELAQMLGRDDAAAELQRRFDAVDAAMRTGKWSLWNESASRFVNRLSTDGSAVEHMAATHFYPLLAGV